ncbi:hypothetical protein [Kistimonas asteriae]|uniref:hypothetical protein n=1 Tax=Kistimonas asteriae TaxID=517724 RepID=UPI001BA4EF61|nr:hypothetical protein [Kistimonas asteriae]
MEGTRVSPSHSTGSGSGISSPAPSASTSGIQVVQPSHQLSTEQQQRKRHHSEGSEHHGVRKTRRLTKPEERLTKTPDIHEQAVRKLLSDKDFSSKLTEPMLRLFNELVDIMFNEEERYNFLTGEHKTCTRFTEIADSLDSKHFTGTTKPEQAAMQFLDKLFEQVFGIDWKEIWKYIPEIKKEKSNISYTPPAFMANTKSGNKTLVSIYNTYYQFIHRARNKSLLEFKLREPECFRLLASLAIDSKENFRELLPMLTKTQKWVLIEWFDSVSYHTKDTTLKWKHMTPDSKTEKPSFDVEKSEESSDDESEEQQVLSTFASMESSLKKIRAMSEYDLFVPIPLKEIHGSLKAAKTALVDLDAIEEYLHKKKEALYDDRKLDSSIKDCVDIYKELHKFYQGMDVSMGQVPELSKDTKPGNYPSKNSRTHTAPMWISLVQLDTLLEGLEYLYAHSRQLNKDQSSRAIDSD